MRVRIRTRPYHCFVRCRTDRPSTATNICLVTSKSPYRCFRRPPACYTSSSRTPKPPRYRSTGNLPNAGRFLRHLTPVVECSRRPTTTMVRVLEHGVDRNYGSSLEPRRQVSYRAVVLDRIDGRLQALPLLNVGRQVVVDTPYVVLDFLERPKTVFLKNASRFGTHFLEFLWRLLCCLLSGAQNSESVGTQRSDGPVSRMRYGRGTGGCERDRIGERPEAATATGRLSRRSRPRRRHHAG